MIFGIGTDIVAYARIEAVHASYGERFAQRILSQQEVTEYRAHTYPVRLLMKRVTHDVFGKPTFEFDAELAAHLVQLGLTHHHLSISDDHDVAVAFVIFEKAD